MKKGVWFAQPLRGYRLFYFTKCENSTKCKNFGNLCQQIATQSFVFLAEMAEEGIYVFH